MCTNSMATCSTCKVSYIYQRDACNDSPCQMRRTVTTGRIGQCKNHSKSKSLIKPESKVPTSQTTSSGSPTASKVCVDAPIAAPSKKKLGSARIIPAIPLIYTTPATIRSAGSAPVAPAPISTAAQAPVVPAQKQRRSFSDFIPAPPTTPEVFSLPRDLLVDAPSAELVSASNTRRPSYTSTPLSRASLATTFTTGIWSDHSPATALSNLQIAGLKRDLNKMSKAFTETAAELTMSVHSVHQALLESRSASEVLEEQFQGLKFDKYMAVKRANRMEDELTNAKADLVKKDEMMKVKGDAWKKERFDMLKQISDLKVQMLVMQKAADAAGK